MLGILYPTSLANLVVEVGTRHSHQTLLGNTKIKRCLFFYLTDHFDLEMIQHFSVCSHPKYKWSDCTKFCTWHNQCGTKPNLIAKILATKFGGFFFVIYVLCFQKYVQNESDDNVIKYHGSEIPHDWGVSFAKFGGLPMVVAFWEN